MVPPFAFITTLVHRVSDLQAEAAQAKSQRNAAESALEIVMERLASIEEFVSTMAPAMSELMAMTVKNMKDLPGAFRGAERSYRTALQLDPRKSATHHNLGNTLKQLKPPRTKQPGRKTTS